MRFTPFLEFLPFIHPKVRLLLAIGIGGFAALILPPIADWEIRALTGWNVGVLTLLLQVVCIMICTSPEQTLIYARSRSLHSTSILIWVILAIFVSVFGIGVMLFDSKDTPQPFRTIQLWLSLAAILGDWLLTHLMFALHYAHLYYKPWDSPTSGSANPCLQFPNETLPDYLDFMYFAFTISMASQTSDTVITARPLRRLVLLHAIVSFFFYSVILALTVNIVASLV